MRVSSLQVYWVSASSLSHQTRVSAGLALEAPFRAKASEALQLANGTDFCSTSPLHLEYSSPLIGRSALHAEDTNLQGSRKT